MTCKCQPFLRTVFQTFLLLSGKKSLKKYKIKRKFKNGQKSISTALSCWKYLKADQNTQQTILCHVQMLRCIFCFATIKTGLEGNHSMWYRKNMVLIKWYILGVFKCSIIQRMTSLRGWLAKQIGKTIEIKEAIKPCSNLAVGLGKILGTGTYSFVILQLKTILQGMKFFLVFIV